MDPVARARAAVERHPAVKSVELVGSRARGDPTELSDWDFLIETATSTPSRTHCRRSSRRLSRSPPSGTA